MHNCSFCHLQSPISGTLVIFTGYRSEDKEYKIIKETPSGRVKGYFEIIRYCPSCLRKYCLGRKYND